VIGYMSVVAAPEVYLRRPVLVATDLADLQGPTGGRIELPLSVYWSSKDSIFDLDDPSDLATVYRTVLREARGPRDLTGLLDGSTLTRK
jgi:hypothetical protein